MFVIVKKKREMDDQQWYRGRQQFTDQISAGIITFGGVVNHRNFLRVNGDATTILNSDANAVGNTTFIGVASQPYAVAWSTQSGTDRTTLVMFKNGKLFLPFDFVGQGASGVREIILPVPFGVGDSFQLRHMDGPPPGPSTVSFYMTPV
jgi:hypothetical protein